MLFLLFDFILSETHLKHIHERLRFSHSILVLGSSSDDEGVDENDGRDDEDKDDWPMPHILHPTEI